MFSFRQKILITYVLVFIIFIALLYPFTQKAAKNIVRKGMEDRAVELTAKLKTASNDDALIRKLKESKAAVFFRISVVTNDRKILYDSHTKRVLGPNFSQDYIVSHPEVLEAFRGGTGYSEGYSDILDQEFAYTAKAFDFHGKTYVLRTAFPLSHIQEITNDFVFGFLASSIAILLLFSAMTWFIINYLTKPITEIITAIKPYQEGQTQIPPEIKLRSKNSSDEFEKLANMLNSLSIKIRNQIQTLTNEKNEKQAILESLIEGVIAVDSRMEVTYINTMAKKLLRLKEQDVLEKNAHALNNEFCFQLLEKCQREEAVLHETQELKFRGEKLFLEVVAAPKTDKTGAILVLQDKTAHYRIIEMRKDFVANASHELKTPITIIRGFAETLHDNPDLPQKTFEEVTTKIVNNCEKMTNLIKDLLTLTDIEHIPESRLSDCSLLDLAESAKAQVQDAYPDASIQIFSQEGKEYHLLVDPNLIELCLVNLIENAAKYSPSPADITVTLDNTGEFAAICIADKGYGIPEEDLENIFHRFYRSEKSFYGRKIQGSGLGLSIVEMIIAKHFGKITVESTVGKGSSFTVFLPLKP